MIIGVYSTSHIYIEMEAAHPPRTPEPAQPASNQSARLPAVPSDRTHVPIPSLIPSQSSQCHFLGSLKIRPGKPPQGQILDLAFRHITNWVGRFFPISVLPSITTDKLRHTTTANVGETHLSTVYFSPSPTSGKPLPIHAIALEHTDRHITGRRWRTEIVLKEEPNGNVKAFVGVYHGLRVGYIGPPPETPAQSTPTIIHHLLRDSRLECFYDIVKSFETPLKIDDTKEHGELFARLLMHPQRTTPLVLMNLLPSVDGPAYPWDPHSLTKSCFGSATVVVPSSPLRVDGPFLSTMASHLGPNGWKYIGGISNGGVRVYQPGVQSNLSMDSHRHRFFYPSQGPDVPRWIQEGIRNTLRATLDANNQVFTFDGVQRAIAQAAEASRWEQLQERVKQAIAPGKGVAIEQERDDLKRLVVALEEELQKQKQGVASLSDLEVKYARNEEELSAASQLLDNASTQIDDLQHQLEKEKAARFESDQQAAVYKQLLDDKQGTHESRKGLTIPTKLPSDPYDAVEFLCKALKPRVVILDTALASAREIPESRLQETWEYLVQLYEVLWPLHFNEETEQPSEVKAHRIPAMFTAKTGIDYTVNESSSTNKDSDLKRQRQVSVDGKEFDFSAHLKVGSKAKDALRIHFAVDEEKRRILVWHCGEHLETAGTRRKS